MTAKRFKLIEHLPNVIQIKDNNQKLNSHEIVDLLNELAEENERLKIAVKDKENLISICEKKFKELGYLITCDDNGYVIE